MQRLVRQAEPARGGGNLFGFSGGARTQMMINRENSQLRPARFGPAMRKMKQRSGIAAARNGKADRLRAQTGRNRIKGGGET
jgi:hypothetical protein